jgi:Guanine nucleotide exchange factor synembryn
VLLNDLKACRLITPPDTALALVALKTLGKQPSGSEVIALPTNLSILLSTLTDDPDILSAALRCVANALLLVEEARTTWVAKDVDGGPFCIDLLQVFKYRCGNDFVHPLLSIQTSMMLDHVFLASRILFLCTASESSSAPFLRSVVEGNHNGSTIVDIIAQRLDTLTDHVLARTEMSCEAMTDLLKFTFNLVLHYPKVSEFLLR